MNKYPRIPTEVELQELKKAVAHYNDLSSPEDIQALDDFISEAHIAIFDDYQENKKIAMFVWEDHPSHYQLYTWTSDGVLIINQNEDIKVY